jgi:hypothetical protein
MLLTWQPSHLGGAQKDMGRKLPTTYDGTRSRLVLLEETGYGKTYAECHVFLAEKYE